MSQGKQHEAGASEGARRATGEASAFGLTGTFYTSGNER